MKTVSYALAAAAILASVATAQRQQAPVKRVASVKTYQLGTAQPKSTSAVAYSNTMTTGYYSVPGVGQNWVDWGVSRLPGGAEHGTITGGEFGYATSAGSGPVNTISWQSYDGYTGWCSSLSAGGLSTTFTGLPGGALSISGFGVGWIVTVDFLGGGGCWYLPGGAPFGYSTMYSNSMTGPLLDSGDSSQNAFDWFTSGGFCTGTYWFGGSPWAGFHAQFDGFKGSANIAGSGCAGTAGAVGSFSIAGNTCVGGSVAVTWSFPTATSLGLSLIGYGNAGGIGSGGAVVGIGGCTWDVNLGGGAALVFGLPSGIVLPPAGLVNWAFGLGTGTHGLQVAYYDVGLGGTGGRSTSNATMMYIP